MPLFSGNLDFHYGGQSSKDFGVIAVQIGSNMYEDQLVASRSVNATKFKNQEKTQLQGIEQEVREFPLTLAFERDFTQEDIDKLVIWLFKDYYDAFYFDNNPDRLVYAMPSGDSTITHNGLNQGYVTITMTTNSSKVYSGVKLSQKLVTTGGLSGILTITNNGHETVYPEFSIRKKGAGKITVVSLDNQDGAIFEIKNLLDDEDIYLDSEREIIETDALGVWHYEDTQGEYPQLLVGKNRWQITGDGEYQVRYKEKFKF